MNRRPIVALYMVRSADEIDLEDVPATITTTEGEMLWIDMFEKLEPEDEVVVTFKDGEEKEGVFICNELNRCYVVTSLNVANPPGWYVNRDQIRKK